MKPIPEAPHQGSLKPFNSSQPQIVCSEESAGGEEETWTDWRFTTKSNLKSPENWMRNRTLHLPPHGNLGLSPVQPVSCFESCRKSSRTTRTCKRTSLPSGRPISWNKPLMFVTADTSQVEIGPASARSCSRPSGDSHCKTAARSSDLCEKALVFVESSTRTLLYNCFSELQAPCRRLAGDLLCPSEEPKLDRVLMGSWLGS